MIIPEMIVKKIDRDLFRDIGFLFVASCFVLVELFDYRLADAAITSSMMVVALLVGLYVLVQLLWVLLMMIDRVCEIFHQPR